MAKLVSFLGTGAYGLARYRWSDGGLSEATPFAAFALAQRLSPSEVVLLVTPEARAHKNRQELEQALQALGSRVTLVDIPNGSTPEEIWKLFAKLRDQLQPPASPTATDEAAGQAAPDHPRAAAEDRADDAEADIILDITHGFRSLPFVAGAVVAFQQAVLETPLRLRLFYAEIETAPPQSPMAQADQPARAGHMRELTSVVDMLGWAQDLRLMLQTGRAEPAAQRAGKLQDSLHRVWRDGGRQGPEPKLAVLARALRDFSLDLQTLRTGGLLLGYPGEDSSVARLAETLRRVAPELHKQAPPLVSVLDRLQAMLAPLQELNQGHLAGEDARPVLTALARLYLQFSRYTEAMATIREAWVSLHAQPAAARPGDDGFDTDGRMTAEARGWSPIVDSRILTPRNRLLHAEYQRGILRAGDLKRQVEEAAEFLDTQACEQDVARNRFVNLSNHPSSGWDQAQRAAAEALLTQTATTPPGDDWLLDLSFPDVPPEADQAALAALTEETLGTVPAATAVAMVMGEHTLCHALIGRLQRRGVRCVAATTRRDVIHQPDGAMLRQFRFVAMRDYAGNPRLARSPQPEATL